MGRRNLFPGRLNGSSNRSDIPRKPRGTAPHDRDSRRCLWEGYRNPRGRWRSLGVFCGGPCGGKPQRVLPLL